jgi:hypothetical protein
MEENDNKQIYIDLRQQLYPLMGSRMTEVLDNYERGEWRKSFQACNSIKMLISSEMNENEKSFFEKVTSKLRDMIFFSYDVADPKDEKSIRKKQEVLSQIPMFLEKYIQLLFKEMSNQGIWFPKAKKHETFQDLLLDECFGLNPEDPKEKIKFLSKMDTEDILKLLPRQEIEKLYIKKEIEDVLHA